MESFGINLQRKNLYNKFYNSVNDIEKGIKHGKQHESMLVEKAEEATDSMQKIMQLSIANPGLLKNQHNQLFLKLMEQVEKIKQKEQNMTVMTRDSQTNRDQ